MPIRIGSKRAVFVCGALVLLVGGLFGRTLRHDFVNLDDDKYVYQNRQLLAGGSESLRWALTSVELRIWAPATRFSFIVDRALYGVNPAGFHGTNVALHAASVVLVFLLAFRIGRSRTGAWALAAFWAVHPLNVEAVAWVTARKDLLYLFFTLLASVVYVDHLRQSSGRKLAWVWLWGALAMTAKPAAVVLPVYLLILAWVEGRNPRRRGVELFPLFLFAAGVSAVTWWAAHEGAFGRPEFVPLAERLGRAPVFVVDYLRRFLWPSGLCASYPSHGLHYGPVRVLASGALLGGMTLAFFLLRHRSRLPLGGWMWFWVGLAPTLDLVQGGQQLLADRYFYVAGLGLIGAGWGLGDLALRPTGLSTKWRRTWPIAVAVGVAGLGVLSWNQVSTWRDSQSLWRRALAVTEGNDQAHINLAVDLDQTGRFEEARAEAEAAVAIRSTFLAHYALGNILVHLNRRDQAKQEFETTLRLRGDMVEAHINLGAILGSEGKMEEAEQHFRRAMELDPRSARAHFNLGLLLQHQGDEPRARREFDRALELDPTFDEARAQLGPR